MKVRNEESELPDVREAIGLLSAFGDPLQQAPSHVDIVQEVAREIARSQEVVAVEARAVTDEVVAERARNPLPDCRSRVFREVYGEVCLPRERLSFEQLSNILQIAVGEANAAGSEMTRACVLRPETLGVGVVEGLQTSLCRVNAEDLTVGSTLRFRLELLPVLVAVPRPIEVRRSRIQRFAAHTLPEVILGPGQVGLAVLGPKVLRARDIELEHDVALLLDLHVCTRRLPGSTVDWNTVADQVIGDDPLNLRGGMSL